MVIKVKDSVVPPRNTKWNVLEATNGTIILRLEDTVQDMISCDVIMPVQEAHSLAVQLLDAGGGCPCHSQVN